MKYIKNVGFIIFAVLIVFSVVFFNFLIDPYNVFRGKGDLDIAQIPRDHYHIIFKTYKNFNADTVFLGSSSTYALFFQRNFYRYYFNLLCKDHFSYEQQYYLLKDYLHFHPETKKVYIFITYPSFYEDCSEPVSHFDGDELNFKDYMFLLFSAETTKRSLKCIKEGKLNQYKDFIIFESIHIIKDIEKLINQKFKTNINLFQSKEEQQPYTQKYVFSFFPNIVSHGHFEKEKNENTVKLNCEYLKKMSELLKEKNIDMHIVIHPYHAIYLSMLAEDPNLQKIIDDLKRTCVQISDNDVYDFSVINKYTTSDYADKNFLYTDFVHPNYVLGMKVFKVLHDNISEDNLYLKLNKKNVEEQIKNSHIKIENYRKKNRSLVNDYLNFYQNNPNIDLFYQETRNFDGAPKYITQELDIYTKKYEKIDDLIRKNIELQYGVWENKI